MQTTQEEFIEVYGARAHNLKNIDIKIPRNKLVVITGLSGSGKSSLAFDTIYAEGQRRYIETFSAYARQFLGNLERPEVDQIKGLSPVISIEQKTVNKNPRSTVGTITEIYDFLRLLYARAADAYSTASGEKMVKYSQEQIVNTIIEKYSGKKLLLLAPVIKGRKGNYKELLLNVRKKGFLKARIDGEIVDLVEIPQLDRFKIHDIEVVIDRIVPSEADSKRIIQSCQTAFTMGKGMLMVQEIDAEEPSYFSKNLMCPTTGTSFEDPEPNTFSFNSPYGACQGCNGLGTVNEVDVNKVVPDYNLSIRQGGIIPLGPFKDNWIYKQIAAILESNDVSLKTKLSDIPDHLLKIVLYGTTEKITIKSKVGLNDYKTEFEGVLSLVERQLADPGNTSVFRHAKEFATTVNCKKCNGSRLKQEALQFKIDEKSINQVVDMDLADLHLWVQQLPKKLSKTQLLIAAEIIKEIDKRISFLLEVGLGYLTLGRSSKTLSGGEAQRIRLATQIGTKLVGVLYILDEPSIGLHQRDNHRLISALKQLRDIGNSVLVVEHDKDIMVEADHIIDIGPKAGVHGGKIIAQGTYAEILEQNSSTAQYLSGAKHINIRDERRPGNGKNLVLSGCTGHNLKNVELDLPLGKFICISGVSGSGKSSLVNHTLYPILNNFFFNGKKKPLPYKKIKGLEHLDKVIEIDQSPIGRTPRSNPATYTKLLDDVRQLYAMVPQAKIRGYKPGRFSFNTKGGRCEECEGAGIKKIEMNFLPDVYVHCEKCNGKRFNRETLEIRYKGHSISDVLDMTIEDAFTFFEAIPKVRRKLETLVDVGLGYLTLGQQSTTLSGGEAQRIKLAAELSKRSTGKTMYILDEPSTGLHFDDIDLLLKVLNRLTDEGNTVVVIEHNLDIIKVADHVIDLGPEGGMGGGKILATGTPEEICKEKKSITGKFLQPELDALKV